MKSNIEKLLKNLKYNCKNEKFRREISKLKSGEAPEKFFSQSPEQKVNENLKIILTLAKSQKPAPRRASFNGFLSDPKEPENLGQRARCGSRATVWTAL